MDQSIRDRIDISQGDITLLKVDAIVNAANKTLWGGGGVDGAIHRAAGPQLLEDCRAIGGCPTGEARITYAYNLPAQYVVHTVGPVYGGRPQDAQLLENCYRNSLQVAVDHYVATIAFPAISCGAYGYPIRDAGRIAIDTTIRFLEDHPAMQKVTFVLFSAADADVYRQILEELP